MKLSLEIVQHFVLLYERNLVEFCSRFTYIY